MLQKEALLTCKHSNSFVGEKNESVLNSLSQLDQASVKLNDATRYQIAQDITTI